MRDKDDDLSNQGTENILKCLYYFIAAEVFLGGMDGKDAVRHRRIKKCSSGKFS